MLRNQQKLSALSILPGISLELNPLTQAPNSARVLRNFIPERGRLKRKPFAPNFTTKPTNAGGDVWHIRNFRYTRASAQENKLLMLRGDGKLYERQSSWEQELYPGNSESSATGADSAATSVSIGGLFGFSETAWTNPSNVASSNDTYATVSLAVLTSSEALRCDNLGFSIPSTSTITGIIVAIEGSATAFISTSEAKLLSAGVRVGTAKNDWVSGFTSTDSTISLGATNDLWGTSFTPADINGTGFGVDIQVATSAFNAANVSIDYISVTVFYGTPGTPLVKKPFAQQLSNRFFFNDAVYKKAYDGRTVYNWGFDRTTTAPTVSAVAAGSLTAATGLKAAITWVHLDEANNRVHESSRTNVSSFQVLAAENLRVDISALSAPTRATHWSAYVSELDGSEVLRRAATTRIGTNTVDISALPAATAAKAPIRNDPPPPSSVGCVGKNRIFLRDETNPERFYFSALGEVKGLLNGAAEESFPGYGTNTISDISNSDFISDRECRCFIEHENIIFIWSERRCFALVGELNLLDNRSPRGLLKLVQFQEGSAGADAAVSTPYGLIWMNPGRKLYLWTGGPELVDIGYAIQTSLDNIPNNELKNVTLNWWTGNGRQWVVLTCKCSTEDDDTDSTEMNRTFIFDFSIPQPRQLGTWFELTDVLTTTSGIYYDEQGAPFLLLGDTSSTVKLADAVSNPCHLNSTAILGKTYLGSSVQNNPRTKLRTGLLLPSGDIFTEVPYVSLLTGDQVGPGAPALGSLTQPILTSRIDIENPDVYGTGISLTLDTAIVSGDRRAWLQPEASDSPTSATSGGTFASFDHDTGTALNAWSNPSNASISDNSYATATVTSIVSTESLRVTNFGFALASNAEVVGILVEAEGSRSGGDSNLSNLALLTYQAATIGSSQGGSALFTTSDAYVSYGGSTSVWGYSGLNGAIVNDSTFGVDIRVSNSGTSSTARIDHVRMTVYYRTVNNNIGGALGKQFIFEASYSAGNDSTGESDGRLTTRLNSIYKMAMLYRPQKEGTN